MIFLILLFHPYWLPLEQPLGQLTKIQKNSLRPELSAWVEITDPTSKAQPRTHDTPYAMTTISTESGPWQKILSPHGYEGIPNLGGVANQPSNRGPPSQPSLENGRFIAPNNAATLAPRQAPPLAQAGDDLFVGTYSQSYRANRLAGTNQTHTPHHVIQDALSQTTRARGVTINLRQDLHQLTRTFRRPVEPGLNLRTHLARDVMDLRRILRDAGYDPAVINRQLQELIRQNKALGGLGKP